MTENVAVVREFIEAWSSLDAETLASYFTEESYVFRVIGDDGELHYGVIRVDHLGVDQNGGIMIFDWAYQLQAGNPDLVERVND